MFRRREPEASFRWRFYFTSDDRPGKYAFDGSSAADFHIVEGVWVFTSAIYRNLYTVSREDFKKALENMLMHYLQETRAAESIFACLSAIENYPEPLNLISTTKLPPGQPSITFNFRELEPGKPVILDSKFGDDATLDHIFRALRCVMKDCLHHSYASLADDRSAAVVTVSALLEMLEIQTSHPDFYQDPASVVEIPMLVTDAVMQLLKSSDGPDISE